MHLCLNLSVVISVRSDFARGLLVTRVANDVEQSKGLGNQEVARSKMPSGLYMAAAGAEAQSQRMQIISNKLANVDTVGFKRELAILQARAAEAVAQSRWIPRKSAP